jgi:hypothetical protein
VAGEANFLRALAAAAPRRLGAWLMSGVDCATALLWAPALDAGVPPAGPWLLLLPKATEPRATEVERATDVDLCGVALDAGGATEPSTLPLGTEVLRLTPEGLKPGVL